MARGKASEARFQMGRLEELDLPDSSVDLVVCALALTHLLALDQAMEEVVRVLVPGGRVVLSDVHPLCAVLGLHALFRTASGERGCIRNLYHPLSHYLNAFAAANLEVARCIEPLWSEEYITAPPTYHLIPQALDSALRGLPMLLVWDLRCPLADERRL